MKRLVANVLEHSALSGCYCPQEMKWQYDGATARLQSGVATLSGGKYKGGRGADDWIDFPAANEIDALAKDALKAFHHDRRGWQAAMEALFHALVYNAQDNALPCAPHIPIDGPHLVGLFSLFAEMFGSTKNGSPHELARVASTGGRPRLSGLDLLATISVATVMGLASVRAELKGQARTRLAGAVARELQSRGGSVEAKECRSHWNNRFRLPEAAYQQIEEAISAFRDEPAEWVFQKALWDAAAILQASAQIKSKA